MGCAGTVTSSISTDTPDGFGNSIKLDCTGTGTPVDNTNDYVRLQQSIEANTLQQLAYGTSSAKTITLSWYMKSVAYTDPITVGLSTMDGTVEYFLKSFTPTTSWVRYSMTVPGSTSATITNDNGTGLQVNITIAAAATPQYGQASDSTARNTLATAIETQLESDITRNSKALDTEVISLETDAGTLFPYGAISMVVKVVYEHESATP